MIKAIVFDWNGTILADTRACIDASNQVIEKFKGKKVKLQEFRDTLTIPAIDFYLSRGCKGLTWDNLGEEWHPLYEEEAKKCRTRRGTFNILKFLKKKAIKSIILTNHTVEGVNFHLDRLNLKDYFSEIFGHHKKGVHTRKRSKRERLKQVIDEIDHNPKEVIIIGDSPEEIEVGKHLGAITIAITNGGYATSRLKKLKPDYLIHNLNEIIDIVKKLR